MQENRCLKDSPICVVAVLVADAMLWQCLHVPIGKPPPDNSTSGHLAHCHRRRRICAASQHCSTHSTTAGAVEQGSCGWIADDAGSDTYLNFLSTTVSSTPKASTSCRKCNSSGVAEQQYHNCLDLAAERQAHLGDEEAVTLIQRHVVQGLSRPDAATFKTSAEKEGRLSRRKGGA
jgi:hypothetical protein